MFFWGQVANSSGWAFGTVTFINAALAVTGWTTGPLTVHYQAMLPSLLVLLWSLLSCLRIDQVGWLNNFAAGLNFLTIIVLVVCLFAMPKTINSPEFVFTDFYNGYHMKVNILPPLFCIKYILLCHLELDFLCGTWYS